MVKMLNVRYSNHPKASMYDMIDTFKSINKIGMVIINSKTMDDLNFFV